MRAAAIFACNPTVSVFPPPLWGMPSAGLPVFAVTKGMAYARTEAVAVGPTRERRSTRTNDLIYPEVYRWWHMVSA